MKRVSLKVDARGAGITERELMEAQEQEAQMALQDRLLAETAKAMNDLESYVYEMRDALSTRLSAFVAESDKEALVAQLTAMEDWLYEDGMDVDKATYEAKLAELTVKVGPVVERERECDARPVALRALHAAVDKFAAFVASTDEAYAHIDSAEKEKASKEVDAAKASSPTPRRSSASCRRRRTRRSSAPTSTRVPPRSPPSASRSSERRSPSPRSRRRPPLPSARRRPPTARRRPPPRARRRRRPPRAPTPRRARRRRRRTWTSTSAAPAAPMFRGRRGCGALMHTHRAKEWGCRASVLGEWRVSKN